MVIIEGIIDRIQENVSAYNVMSILLFMDSHLQGEGMTEKNKKKIALEVLEAFKKEHKQEWLDFMKGMLWGYMHGNPKYKEALVSDFEKWLLESKETK